MRASSSSPETSYIHVLCQDSALSTCKTIVAIDSADVPFCSDRCRLLDLGKWAAGEYKISSPILDPDLLEELEHSEQQRHPVAEEKSRYRH